MQGEPPVRPVGHQFGVLGLLEHKLVRLKIELVVSFDHLIEILLEGVFQGVDILRPRETLVHADHRWVPVQPFLCLVDIKRLR